MLKNKKYQTYLFALLLLSGMLKSFVFTYIGKIDVVLIVAVLVVIDIVISKGYFTKYSVMTSFILLVFSSYLVFSMGYSNSTDYLYDKLQGYVLALLYFIYPFFIKKFYEKKFIIVYSIILIPLTIFFVKMKSILWTTASLDTEMFMNLRSNYLDIALHLGILIIMLNYYKKNGFFQLFCLGLLFATSARGPFTFVLIVLFLINFRRLNSLVFSFSKFIKSSVVAVIAGIVVFYNSNNLFVLFETAISRFSNLFENDNSLNHRQLFMEYAFFTPFNNIEHFFFGSGFASFGIDFFGVDIRAYPHNILLEIFYEMGVIGVFIFILFMFFTFYKAYNNKTVFYFILIFIVLNSLKSYSLADSWILFAMLGSVLREHYMEIPQQNL